MAYHNAVEALLDEAELKANAARPSEGRRNVNDDRNLTTDRNSNGNRNYRNDTNDRYSPRETNNYRTGYGRRPKNIRESDGDDRRSRATDRDSRPREDSRPRSDEGADNTDHDRRRDTNDRYRPELGGRGRDRGGDFYDGSGRARSRSPVRDRDVNRVPRGSDDRPRRGSNDRPRRGSDDRGRRGGRSSATPPEDDRDRRTIFVQQISQRTRTYHLREFFEQVGPVVEAQIVKDRVTQRSKGVGYVEFKDLGSVEKALEKTGQKLRGIPIIVQLTEAEKNRAARPSEGGAAAGANGAPFHRLYVGNIHFSIGEDDLREIFGPFGELDQVTLQRDEANPGRSKGYGFVQFVNPEDAKKALQEMNGFELANRQIRVGLGNDKFTPESTANLLRQFGTHAQAYQGSAFSGAGGRGTMAGGSGGVFDRTRGRDDRAGVSGASALDDTDVSGVNYKSFDRTRLMQNLLQRENQSDKDVKVATKVAVVAPQPQPKAAASVCVKMENVFDPDEERALSGDTWVEDLKSEMKHECNERYGNVVDLYVVVQAEGEVHVKFDSLAGSRKAIEGLNGRSFNGRTLTASYESLRFYDAGNTNNKN